MSQAKEFGIGYVRVSSDKQGGSREQQMDSNRAKAHEDGVEIPDDLWCIDEGVSGSTMERPGLKRVFFLCKTRKDASNVYTYDRSRFSRSTDPLDGLNIERGIERLGKRVRYVHGTQKTGDLLTDTLTGVVDYSRTGQYLVDLSDRTIRGQLNLRRKGHDMGRLVPYGFDRQVVDGSGKELYRVRHVDRQITHKILSNGDVQVYRDGQKPAKDKNAHSRPVRGDPERAKIAKEIYESYVWKEMGDRAICEMLNARGIPSPLGGKWGVGTVRAILTNPIYYGANVWNRRSTAKVHRIENGKAVRIELVDGKKRIVRRNDRKDWIESDGAHDFEPIISKELFDLAQAKRQERNKPFTRGKAVSAPYYLSGLAKCTCRHNLQGRTLTSGKTKGCRKYYYYVCGGFYMKGRGFCQPYHLPKNVIEQPVFENLKRRLMVSDRTASIETKVKGILQARLKQQGPNESAELLKRLKYVEGEAKNWERAISLGLNIERAVSKVNELTERKKRLETDLGQARMRERLDVDIVTATKEVVAQIERLPEVLAHGSVAEVKSVLRGFIATIEYNPETRNARVGFYPLERSEPARAILGFNAPENARISGVSGARVEPATLLVKNPSNDCNQFHGRDSKYS
jgi:DNA invertase Pin-like site-specific DNA recombinase